MWREILNHYVPHYKLMTSFKFNIVYEVLNLPFYYGNMIGYHKVDIIEWRMQRTPCLKFRRRLI